MREREVWERLGAVTDPELDEPITEMGFVEEVSVGPEGDVEVGFRLPTYWCSPNFAFLMAEGVHREVDALPCVRRVRVRLEDHLCADELNEVVHQGGGFSEAFAIRPDGGDLDEVRAKFDRKAFQRRPVARRRGGDDARGARRRDLRGRRGPPPGASLSRDAGEARFGEGRVGAGFSRSRRRAADEAGYRDRMSALRAVRINMEFGGALCRGLKQSRYKEAVEVDGEPTLVDFILDRVPQAATG